ncbi:hypothetical protein OROHE_015783 [Orobanche hederae]
MALMKIDTDFTLSRAHPETMDYLSHAWCDFAVQALQHESKERSLVLQENSIKMMDKSAWVDDGNIKFVKSWIWMQQAMHPEVNYNSYFRKKWLSKALAFTMSWKLAPLKNTPIKNWLKEIKQRRKEERRLQKAEVHAAISVAGVAAALAAMAVKNSQQSDENTTNEAAVASAAATLVAAECAKVAEAMGAKREQLSSVIGSTISCTSTSEIVTFTAAATTSIRGADTLKARSAAYKSIMNGSSPVLPFEGNNEITDFDYDKCRLILAKGENLNIETTDGRYVLRSVAVILKNGKQLSPDEETQRAECFRKTKGLYVLFRIKCLLLHRIFFMVPAASTPYGAHLRRCIDMCPKSNYCWHMSEYHSWLPEGVPTA